jgi:pimeloyl-ACP methyl ester carboxylesterase
MSELSTSTDAGLPGHSLRVKGASVFYRVRGHGPHLLILPGGDGDADTTEDLCRHLVDRYSVITYDRRGMSRSTVDDPTDTLTLDTHSDDVHRLLATLTSQPVLVFGSSIGALIGLDLVARHSEQVSVLVAHEPPAFDLLPATERNRAMQLQEEAEAAFQGEGVEAGFRRLVTLAAVDYNDREADVARPPSTSQRSANLSFFFRHDSPAVRRYHLDVSTLRASSARIVPAVAQSAPDSAPHKAAVALAAALGEASSPFLVVIPAGFFGRKRLRRSLPRFDLESVVSPGGGVLHKDAVHGAMAAAELLGVNGRRPAPYSRASALALAIARGADAQGTETLEI